MHATTMCEPPECLPAELRAMLMEMTREEKQELLRYMEMRHWRQRVYRVVKRIRWWWG